MTFASLAMTQPAPGRILNSPCVPSTKMGSPSTRTWSFPMATETSRRAAPSGPNEKDVPGRRPRAKKDAPSHTRTPSLARPAPAARYGREKAMSVLRAGLGQCRLSLRFLVLGISWSWCGPDLLSRVADVVDWIRPGASSHSSSWTTSMTVLGPSFWAGFLAADGFLLGA